MRIGIYDPYLDDGGGGEKYMMSIAECLSSQHEVSVFWNRVQDLEQIKERFSLALNNIKLVKNIFSREVSLLTRIKETHSYDVIIFLSDGSVPISFSRKLFLHLQQPLEQLHNLPLFTRLKLQRVSGVFYNSEFTKTFNNKYISQISNRVIYPPVTIKKEEVKKENIILHVGRFRVQEVITGMSDFKKQQVMVNAFKQIIHKKKIPGWKFVLAVSVRDEDKEQFVLLQDSAKGYPIEFFVNKTNDALWETYNKAKIYWHASGFGEDLAKHPEYAEHFGISTVEAMGAGAVPVVINAGGQREIVTNEKNGLLWNTIEELHDKTVRVANDQKLWQKLSIGAIERANDFSNEKFCEAINQMISS